MLPHSLRDKRVPAGLGLAFLSSLALLTARPALAQTQYSFTSFDVTDSTGAVQADTAIFGLNDAGQIAGSFVDSSGNTNAYYGTTASQSTVDLSKVLTSQFLGFSEINKINNGGTYAGDFEMSTVGGYTTQQGFVGTNGSAISTALSNSQALGINNLNDTVGLIQNADGTVDQSYLESHTGDLTVFDVPGFGTSEATAINDSGTIVGTAAADGTTGPTVSYIRTTGANPTFSFLSIPDAYDVFAQDINNTGTIVGGFDSFTSGEEGFALSHGILTTIVFPDALDTEVEAINSQGDIAGVYIDEDGIQHAFLADPVPEASTLLSFGLLLSLGGVMLAAKRKQARTAA